MGIDDKYDFACVFRIKIFAVCKSYILSQFSFTVAWSWADDTDVYDLWDNNCQNCYEL